MPANYGLFVPAQAVGASLVYFDLFNPSGSCLNVFIMSVLPIVSTSAAVAPVTGVDLFLTRTSAIGTGGTAATRDGSSLTAATFSSVDNSQPLDPSITARLTPTGGATAGAVISQRCVFCEETLQLTSPVDMVRNGYTDQGYLIVPENTGIRVVQGSVAAAGNIGFDVSFFIRKSN